MLINFKKIILALLIIFSSCSISQAYTKIADYQFLDNPQYTLPYAISEHKSLNESINNNIAKEAKAFLAFADQLSQEAEREATTSITYTITCNDQEVLSILLEEYLYLQGLPHPAIFHKGISFDIKTGQRITLEALEKGTIGFYSAPIPAPEELSLYLKNTCQKMDITLYEKALPLTKLPEDFFFEEDHHLNFIFQEQEVAPHACGIIHVDVDTPIN